MDYHKKPKFQNKKIIIDGNEFDSQVEGRRYEELKAMKRAGIISDFEIQPRFLLQEAYRKCPACNNIQEHVFGSRKKMHTHCRECGEPMKYWPSVDYFADFKLIYPDGTVRVEDVKGTLNNLDKVFKVKWHFFERMYPDLKLELVVMPPVRKTTTTRNGPVNFRRGKKR